MKKLIYGVNLATFKGNESLDGYELVCGKISDELDHTIQSQMNERNSFIEKHLKSLYVPMFTGGISFLLIYILSGIYESLTELQPNSEKVIQSILFMLILIFVPSLILFIIRVARLFRMVKSEKMKDNQKKLEDSLNLAFEQLEIPSTSQKMDIISTRYWKKNNQYKVKNVENVDCLVWLEIDALKICNMREIFCIPLLSIASVTQVKKKLTFPKWNKEIGPSKEEYKKYKISARNKFTITIRSFYIITITHNGEEYELHLPNYEMDSFRKLTGYKD